MARNADGSNVGPGLEYDDCNACGRGQRFDGACGTCGDVRRPTPVGKIAAWQSMHDHTVAIAGCRVAPEALEGKVLVLAPDYGENVEAPFRSPPPPFREPRAFVRGAVAGPDGAVLVLLPGGLATCVPAAAAGDLVYLEDEIAETRVRRERADVEAWKAEQRARG